MSRTGRWLLGLTALVLLAADEPSFNDRPLSEWVTMLKSDPQPRKRRAAVVALGELAKTSDDTRTLVLVSVGKALRQDADPQVRKAAADLLARQPAEVGTLVISDVLASVREDRTPEVRKAALLALRQFAPSAEVAVPLLTELLTDPDAQIQLLAAETLGRVGAPAAPAAAALVKLAASDSLPLKRATIVALGRIAPVDVNQVTPPLLSALKSPDAGLRKDALTSLGLLGDRSEATLKAIAGLLTSGDAAERSQALDTLGQAGLEASVTREPVAERLTGDADAAVRVQAARAYRRVSPIPLDLLAERLPLDPSPEVRVAIAEELGALGGQGQRALPALRVARGDPSPQVREAATVAIRRIESPEPVVPPPQS